MLPECDVEGFRGDGVGIGFFDDFFFDPKI